VYNIYGDLMKDKKTIFMPAIQKERFDFLKNAYTFKTKKHIMWGPFLDIVLNILEAEINKMPDFKDPVIKVQPENMVGIEEAEAEDPNFSD